MRTEEGELHLFVAVDGTSKYAFPWLKVKATTATAREFLDELAAAVPYRIHSILTDTGIQFADLPKNREKPAALWRGHPVDRLPDPRHRASTHQAQPSLDQQPGRTDEPTLKEAAVRRYHYEIHDQLESHLAVIPDAYNFARRLKTLRGLTLYEAICKAWSGEPDRFRLNPVHWTSGTEQLGVF